MLEIRLQHGGGSRWSVGGLRCRWLPLLLLLHLLLDPKSDAWMTTKSSRHKVLTPCWRLSSWFDDDHEFSGTVPRNTTVLLQPPPRAVSYARRRSSRRTTTATPATTSNDVSTPVDMSGTSLGDIMNTGLLTSSSSSSSSTSTNVQSLQQQYGIVHPMDRVILTANGNLQRILASYYDAPVSVHVHHCHLRSDHTAAHLPAIWDRVVDLRVLGHVVCTATSVITVHDAQCAQWVQSGQVGLGQLFRYLDLLPEFTLLDAGMCDAQQDDDNGGGGFWRRYRLECHQLICEIHEEFCPGLWELEPNKE